MTTAGPEPMEAWMEEKRSPIDYEHYLAKQLEPVADGILPFVGDSFARLTSPQGALF
jgi:DNA polymerase-2